MLDKNGHTRLNTSVMCDLSNQNAVLVSGWPWYKYNPGLPIFETREQVSKGRAGNDYKRPAQEFRTRVTKYRRKQGNSLSESKMTGLKPARSTSNVVELLAVDLDAKAFA